MAPATASAPQQLKQPSRKGKWAWRKNVDLSEIQTGLDSLRDELIQGGVIAEKPSEQLFTVDTAGNNSRPTSLPSRHQAFAKPLKADQVLGQRSAIPAVDARKRSGVTDGVLEPRKRHRTPYVTQREYERLRRVGQGSGSDGAMKAGDGDGAPTHDPWSVAPAVPEEQYSFLEPPRTVREPATLKAAPVSLLASAQAAPAVAKPKPGASYNPVFEDWDALMTAEGEKEIAAELKRHEEARADAEREARIVAAQAGEGEESAWEGFDSEYEDPDAVKTEWGRPTKVKIKTRAERNKIQRRKEKEREEKLRARQRRVDAEARRAKEIAKEVRRQEKGKGKGDKAPATAEDGNGAGAESEEEVDDEKLRRHLKKSLLPPKPLELVLPDELQDSLRRLRPEGNLLRERFRSAVIRGRVEPRKPVVQPRKPKRYIVEKWSYRDFPIVT